MKVCVTIDMDNYQDYQRLVDRDGTADGASFYLDAVPRFLDLLDRHRVRGTFFMVGRDARVAAHRPVVRDIAARGHEVANHSWSHPYNFRAVGRAGKIAEIEQGEAAIADVLGERPVGFRTPSCDVDVETLELLAERGYRYDSSIFPSPVMWAFMIYGKLFVRRPDYQLGHVASVFAPNRPFLPRRDRVWRPRAASDGGGPPLVEIPFSVVPGVRIPFYSTMLRLFGPRGFDLCVRAFGRGRPLNVLFHLIEVADLEETSLGRAMARTPGLGLSLARREQFVSSAVARLARAGESVTMRELARDYLPADARAA
jgi:hypothetical protein